MALDYTLYLVTDSTPAVLGEKKLEDVVQAAVDGGMWESSTEPNVSSEESLQVRQ